MELDKRVSLYSPCGVHVARGDRAARHGRLPHSMRSLSWRLAPRVPVPPSPPFSPVASLALSLSLCLSFFLLSAHVVVHECNAHGSGDMVCWFTSNKAALKRVGASSTALLKGTQCVDMGVSNCNVMQCAKKSCPPWQRADIAAGGLPILRYQCV